MSFVGCADTLSKIEEKCPSTICRLRQLVQDERCTWSPVVFAQCSFHDRSTHERFRSKQCTNTDSTGFQSNNSYAANNTQLGYGDEAVQTLLDEMDQDKSGLVDFEEFCVFLARVK